MLAEGRISLQRLIYCELRAIEFKSQEIRYFVTWLDTCIPLLKDTCVFMLETSTPDWLQNLWGPTPGLRPESVQPSCRIIDTFLKILVNASEDAIVMYRARQWVLLH